MVRSCMLLAAASALAAPLLIAWLASGLTFATSLVFTAASLAGILVVFRRKIPGRLADAGRAQPILLLLWTALTLFAGYRLARLSVFMLDVERTEYAFNPTIRDLSEPELQREFFPRHNCFTSYVIAAHLAARRVDNVFLPTQYRNPTEETVIHQTIGDALTVDTYQYPPPFLVLPRLLLATGGDFFRWRAYWFAFNVFVLALAVVSLMLWLGSRTFHVFWFAWPLILIAPVTQGTLQIGNAHFLIICLCVLAMVAFARKWDRFGGVLLGFAIVSKVFPGVLLAYLLFRRRWSAVIWTTAAMGALCLITGLMFGAEPFEAFAKYHVPRLASGEAFGFAREHIRPLIQNQSVMGVPFKLQKLGVLGEIDPVRIASVSSWLYSGILLIAIIYLGLKRGPARFDTNPDRLDPYRTAQARIWLVLLVLAQLRNPFLPWTYGNLAVGWLIVLLLPVGREWSWRSLWVVGGWLFFAVTLPLAVGPQTIVLELLYTLVAFMVVLVLCYTVIVRSARTGQPMPVHAL